MLHHDVSGETRRWRFPRQNKGALDWVDTNRASLSDWHSTIWDFHEPAWREYKSAAWYVDRLRQEGFEVEEGSGGMPTAFAAVWDNGDGPTIGSYAEYDAVPGNCQDRVPYQKTRDGVHRAAAGHTDPHSALGMAALGACWRPSRRWNGTASRAG